MVGLLPIGKSARSEDHSRRKGNFGMTRNDKVFAAIEAGRTNLGQPELLQKQYQQTAERKRAVHKTGAVVREIRSAVVAKNPVHWGIPKTIEDKRNFINS